MKQTQYTPGTVISVKKSPFITHYGIFIGNNQVIDANPEVGRVRKTSLAKFSGGAAVMTVDMATSFNEHEIVNRAENLLGRPYRLFTNNCEHFVTDVVAGRPFSNQVLLGLVGLGVAYFYFRR